MSLKKVCCTVHVVSLHLALSTLMFHSPSLLFPDEHFSSPAPLSSLSRPKTVGHAHSHMSGGEFVYMAASLTSTGYEPKLLDKNTSVDDDMTPINDSDHDSISCTKRSFVGTLSDVPGSLHHLSSAAILSQAVA